MRLWAHTLVKNEERYLWYAVRSVIDRVDKIFLWDTGSTDNTIRIIEELRKIYPQKIHFREMGEVDPSQFTAVRQKMLEDSDCDWIVIVDGDEVWWKDSISEVRRIIEEKGTSLDSIVSRYYNVVGDIYHFQDESAGNYEIDGKRGNYNIRAFRRTIKGIKFVKPHGQQGISDAGGVLLQNMPHGRRWWTDGYSYLHFTNMPRSGKRIDDLKVPKRDFKLKYELGKSFPMDFYYPESFFSSRPDFLDTVWKNMGWMFKIRASIVTPLKWIKRKALKSTKSGY